LLSLAPLPAWAQSSAPVDQARITGAPHAVAAPTGRIAINQAAGAGNVQANLAALALAPDGRAVIGLQSRQQAQPGDRQRSASAVIQGQSFNDGSGLLSLNQAAGSGNAQLNLFGIGIGIGIGHAAIVTDVFAGLDDAALAAVAGDNATEGAGASPLVRTATIDSDAFRGSQGVVQVNQTAGVGNASFNAIVLQLPGGAL